jgi:Signal transduction histidine kinase
MKSILTIIKQNTVWLAFFGSSILMLVIAIVASTMMISSAKIIEETSKQHLLALSRAAALLVPADDLDRFLKAEDMELQEYKALNERLIEFNTLSGTEYTYFLRLDEATNRMQFVIDNSVNTDALSVPPVPRENAPDIALTGKPICVDLGSYSEGWEGYMTAYAPVYYEDGRLSKTIAGVDMLDKHIKTAQQNMRRLSDLLIFSILLALGACLHSLLLYRRKARQALIASEAKSSFLSRMSHEIRTPLNAIIGFCDMSLSSGNMATVKEYLGYIDSSSNHLRQIIDDVLDISKIESGKVVLEYLPAECAREVAKIENIIRPQADKKNQKFEVSLGPGVPHFVLCDVVHLRQIIVNLLSNAIKFTPENGTVKFSVTQLETVGNRSKLLWTVEDTGIGITKKQQQTLFQPFEQADISTTRKYGGTGLGLSISRNLVEMMGGTIQIESNAGEGSRFFFALWVDIVGRDSLEEGRVPEEGARKVCLRGEHVLVVEDVETNQIIIQDILEKYGAIVEIAKNGREGYETYAASPDAYTLILMDIQMPVLDGYAATEMIRASGFGNAGTIPIVAMTANVYREDVEKALASGMNGHIGKPFDLVQIEQIFVKLLGTDC